MSGCSDAPSVLNDSCPSLFTGARCTQSVLHIAANFRVSGHLLREHSFRCVLPLDICCFLAVSRCLLLIPCFSSVFPFQESIGEPGVDYGQISVNNVINVRLRVVDPALVEVSRCTFSLISVFSCFVLFTYFR